ncbi:MAG: hypothetical protein HZA63_17630 [Rhodocyclales bacterium]|nr:hypothetical protein [Rhodocyclales bacterium]
MTVDPDIERNVRRTVGIEAMRRIRRIVDADNELEAQKARWAQRIALALIGAAALALAWFAFR